MTRRLYGNLGGYTALALYCFSPAVLRACVTPNAEVLAALGVYGGVYTCIGVAHAMQGPRRKWRPRIVLLTAIFGVAAAAHIAALPVVALLGLALMLWVAEGRRSQVLPVVLIAAAGALVLLFACYGFSPHAFSCALPLAGGLLWFSLDPARRFFSTLSNAGITSGHGCRAGAISFSAPLALLRELRSAALRFGSLSPCSKRRPRRRSLALGADVSVYLCGRSLCRRIREQARTACAGRCRGSCAAAGCLLCSELAGAAVKEER